MVDVRVSVRRIEREPIDPLERSAMPDESVAFLDVEREPVGGNQSNKYERENQR